MFAFAFVFVLANVLALVLVHALVLAPMLALVLAFASADELIVEADAAGGFTLLDNYWEALALRAEHLLLPTHELSPSQLEAVLASGAAAEDHRDRITAGLPSGPFAGGHPLPPAATGPVSYWTYGLREASPRPWGQR